MSIKPQPPIVTAVCDEPEGVTIRYVYPMYLTPENLQKFWEKARKFPHVFGHEIKDDFKAFCELFISQDGNTIRSHGLFWVIDDFVGIYYMNHIQMHDAIVHYTFFDRRQKGREELTREMLRYVVRRFDFWRLSVEIPEYASSNTFGFTASLGFKKEGTKRNAISQKGVMRSVKLFGVTREEILENGN